MDHSGPIARRFPLIARFRPACLPLPARVAHLAALADTSERHNDEGVASSVYNQAALLASDLGLPGLAQAMCHEHAAAYLRACPLPAMNAIRGLEPLVNLARLHIRAGHPDAGRERLLALYEAVTAGTAATVDGIVVPADLTKTAEDRHEVRAWLWRVLLADGTRTLTTEGRWPEALAHIEQHRGVGTRMLDGRQVAVLAALTNDDTDRALDLLANTVPGEPWEQAVSACLTVLCRRDANLPHRAELDTLLDTYRDRDAAPGLTVFETRLGLSVLDAMGTTDVPAAHRVADDLYRQAMELRDGYAAREVLAHQPCSTLVTARQAQDLTNLIQSCALGAGTMSAALQADLSTALDTSRRVLARKLLGLTRYCNNADL
ncbi:hypothetical protein AB8O64_11085 [Streptomyces sp. QH1-20]|uniref:hypothetical protein n=1 Tax=Streptomyces sp. QH1-20 TaxID=3240934 RepID=UPI003516CA02